MQAIHENISAENGHLKNDYRERIELLTERINLLSGTDRVLMTMYLVNGNTFYQMAKLSGISQSTVARRIHKVTRKLINGGYIICLRSRDEFEESELEIARDYFLAGKSIKQIASKHKITYYKAHNITKKLRDFVKSMQF
ncbi:MAG TPA: hypothetical protein PLP05_05565 [Sedimentisphaerales bacterium]|nr:hypothetical protein [Sedimentisphaerales bacterium]